MSSSLLEIPDPGLTDLVVDSDVVLELEREARVLFDPKAGRESSGGDSAS